MLKLFSKMIIPSFETDRLLIRPLQVSDYQDLFETFREKDYLKYFGIGSVNRKEDAKRLVRDWVSRMSPNQFIRWAICLKSSGKTIGTIGLHTFIEGYRKAAVGYDLNPHYQKQGYMQESLQMIMRYFFEDMGYHRLEAIIVDQNISSIHVIERAGFKQEGKMKEWMYHAGLDCYFDAYIYALLDSEYERLL